MRFRVLGTLEVRTGDGLSRLGAAKQRTLLAVLLVNVNRPVDVARLVDALWPRGSPRTAPVALRTYVSALRRVLGLAGHSELPRLATVPGGYQMCCAPTDLDLLAFEDFVSQGQQALADGHPALAAERLRRALGLWRGRPFEDVALDAGTRVELIRLEERRIAAEEAWIDTQLALGHHEDLLAELGSLTAAEPMRERLWAQWMLALHRSGRRADALRAYRDLRQHLVRELGIEPSPPLQRLHVQILTGHADIGAPARVAERSAPPAVPRQLPADIASFTGRDTELARLLKLAADRPPALVISSIDGMAGIGKTALAVHAAHRLADRFTDGQLFVDLHGFTKNVSPVRPADALDRMLRCLGVLGEQLPHDLDARAALFRTRLAGKRMLILLDNAATEAQVLPLLPGTASCMVLITSRTRLPGLTDAQPISLNVLPAREALDLFIRTAGARRLADTPLHQIAEIVELCGHLPLAIRVAAARLRARSNWPAAHLADRLRDRRHRLAELTVGGLSVPATIDLSYRHLSSEARRMYGLLGLHPGPDLDLHAAAALTGKSLRYTGNLLDSLVDAHLVQEPVARRYRFHDLLRAHAAAVSSTVDTESERQAALIRLFGYYAATASVVMDMLYPYDSANRPSLGQRTDIPSFADRTQAAAWLDTELTNLLAVAAHGRPRHAMHLSATLRRHLHARAHYRQAHALHHDALRAARATGNLDGELTALCGLGDVHIARRQYRKAMTRFERALEIAEAAGNRAGELSARTGLGSVHQAWSQGAAAEEHFGRALEIARGIGDRTGQLNALRGLGHVNRPMGRHDVSADHFGQALKIARATGNREGELNALWGLGHANWLRGRRGEAATCHKQALDIARATGNRLGELCALIGLAYVHLFQEMYEPATDYYLQILTIALEVGDRNSEFEALYGLGHLYRATGHPDRAITYHQAALEIARDLGQSSDQARALHGLARTHQVLGQQGPARAHWQRALDILTELGLPEAEDLSAADIRAHLAQISTDEPDPLK
ncbi:DNA-binding SARP family transcriptional activator/Tfp pilus assembly protein PilF [Kibdelosporangium banguiense]|uniref:DNA-binding SARP family transcriptional activator/Tfp pilus assembly protein PilF n=1 Tax=Kibdelosporangium banguiense TaxID=1365924 RepID=A0ABS4TSX2_9PSEU|nr:AfsR/SARP family transcriptional regulator [Kibdelosporangium banguiense]MBP2327011.1 DNA-binding SARP family transcriptional activator/Tfp pilus assembly protein PilF [Kibdelosporangium banguiense]